MNLIDLNIRTNYSNNGYYSPKEILMMAIEYGLHLISITDYHCMAGIKELLEKTNTSIRLIPAVTFRIWENNYKIEIIAYGLDPYHPDLEILNNLDEEESLYHNCQDTIAFIHKLHGLAILANPSIYDNHMDALDTLCEYGLDGIEVYSGKHCETQIKAYRDYTKNKSLIRTCGSGFSHWNNSNNYIGKHTMPKSEQIELMDILKKVMEY